MIAVDATVLADFVVGEARLRASAVAFMREDSDWVSVGLWRYEFGNVVGKKARFEDGDPGEARIHVECGARLLVETVEDIAMGAVYDMAAQTGLTFYDASYVWLARARGLILRTRDQRILRDCPEVARPMPVV